MSIDTEVECALLADPRAQPSELKSSGYAFVINLATSSSSGVLAEAGMLIAKSGISFDPI